MERSTFINELENISYRDILPEVSANEGVVTSLYLKRNINEADKPANTPMEAKNM